MAVGSITKRAVDALKPGQAEQYLWDDEVSGFGLKVTPKGGRTYLLQYRMGGRGTPTRRFTIGKHGTWTPEEARKEARRLRQMVDRGVDPQQAMVDRLRAAEEQKRQAVAFDFAAYVGRFLAEYGKANWRPGTYRVAEMNLRKHVVPQLAGKSLFSIRRTDITAMLDAIPSEQKSVRRSAYAYTRKLFSWAVARGDLEKSPVDGMQTPAAVASRDRVLSDGELRSIWTAAEATTGPFGPLVKLLLLTGQRRDEVAVMGWDEVDRSAKMWTIPAARTKNGREHLVPLSDPAIAVLDVMAGSTEWPRAGHVFTTGNKPFSSFSKSKATLDEATGVAGWRLHDLRRTLTTGLQRLGIRFEVTEAVLNHVSGAKAGVAGVYQRHDWKDEKRAALEAWARHIESFLHPQDQTNVVTLHAS
jgi:integrase